MNLVYSAHNLFIGKIKGITFVRTCASSPSFFVQMFLSTIASIHFIAHRSMMTRWTDTDPLPINFMRRFTSILFFHFGENVCICASERAYLIGTIEFIDNVAVNPTTVASYLHICHGAYSLPSRSRTIAYFHIFTCLSVCRNFTGILFCRSTVSMNEWMNEQSVSEWFGLCVFAIDSYTRLNIKYTMQSFITIAILPNARNVSFVRSFGRSTREFVLYFKWHCRCFAFTFAHFYCNTIFVRSALSPLHSHSFVCRFYAILDVVAPSCRLVDCWENWRTSGTWNETHFDIYFSQLEMKLYCQSWADVFCWVSCQRSRALHQQDYAERMWIRSAIRSKKKKKSTTKRTNKILRYNK